MITNMRESLTRELVVNDVEATDENTAKDIANHLGSRLSPENLACDGELSYSQIKSKLKYLNNIELEFHKHCDSVGITRQEILY